jgi:apolipoprotein N-acyltransferase
MHRWFGEVTMSAGARVTLAIACTLIGASFAILAALSGDTFEGGPLPFYGLAALCALVALACLVPQTRPVTVRLIGGVVFASCAWLLYSHAEGDMRGALAVFVVCGPPAGYAVVMGTNPPWGKGSVVFHGSPERDEVQDE